MDRGAVFSRYPRASPSLVWAGFIWRFGNIFVSCSKIATTLSLRIRVIHYCAATLVAIAPALGAETNAAPADQSTPREPADVAVNADFLRRFHEDLASSLRAAEEARAEAEANAKRNEEAMALRLNSIEQLLRAQFEREVGIIKDQNQFMMTLVATLSAIGILGILLAALVLSRSVNRVADTLSISRAPSPLAPAGGREFHRGRASLTEHSRADILGAIEQIQKRLDKLVQPTKGPSAVHDQGLATDPDASLSSESDASQRGAGLAGMSIAKRIELLLGKAQALIHLNQAESALACFEEILALDADNLDALVRRGTALEKLGRADEAIACYDHAISLDRSLTTAHLLKGALFNRLGRHSEAMHCFEEALRAQGTPNGD